MTTPTDDLLARLATLCDPDPQARELVRAPFTVEVDGRIWTGATEGHMLMLVATETEAPRVPPERLAGLAAKLTEGWPATGQLDRSVLRAWVGGHDPAECPTCQGETLIACPDCDGEDDTTECVCPNCGDEHEAEDTCDTCFNVGTITCRHGLAARHYGVLTSGDLRVGIDRTFLVNLLPLMTGERVEVMLSGPLDMVRFRGAGWVAAQMPIREYKPTPGFELALQ